jgi:hypothetical protein
MSFKRRLVLFGFGIILGLILSAFFFAGRTSVLTAWLPNARVISRFKSTKLVLKDNTIKCKFNCLGITSKDLSYAITDGDVLFSESKTNQKPILYVVYAEPENGEPFKITFAAEDSVSTIVDVSLALMNRDCNCQ